MTRRRAPKAPPKRDRISVEEIERVLRRYDIGRVRSVRPFERGSRRSPKLVIETERDRFLLKRRAPGNDDPYQVAFSHKLIIELGARGFPVATLIGTTDTNNSMLQLSGRVYEMFRYVEAEPFDRSRDSTHDAGARLGSLHELLAKVEPRSDHPRTTFHQNPHAVSALGELADQAGRKDKHGALVRELTDAYAKAGDVADRLVRTQTAQLIHADWHPGNMLFRSGRVAAVLDFDSSRLAERCLDLAGGVLHFSLVVQAGRGVPFGEGLDLDRARMFWRGYANEVPRSDAAGVVEIMVPLMVEAMISESVVPIAREGHFGPISGWDFLTLVHSQVRWLAERQSDVIAALND